MNYQDFTNLQTPCYVFSLDELTERLRRIRALLGGRYRLVYAMKANPFLIEAALPFVDALEVCSPGEEKICEAAGIPPEKLVLSGVNKEPENFRHIAGRCKDAPVYTAESPAQLRMLDEIARERQLVFRVLLRVTAGNQFGMDEPDLFELIRIRDQYLGITVCGLQYFSGTQKFARQIRSEVRYLDDLLERLRTETGFVPDVLEYGPGLSVSYFENETDRDDAEVIAALTEQLDGMRFSGPVALEMGRYLAAYCGYYATRIADCKQISGRTCCIVDGGIHQVNYFGQAMAMKVPHILTKADKTDQRADMADKQPDTAEKQPDEEARNLGISDPAKSCMICGSLCTTADVLVREITLPDPQPGDLLVFTRTGAYSVTEGISLFLSRNLPRVYLAYSSDDGKNLTGESAEISSSASVCARNTNQRIIEVRTELPTWRMNYGTIT